MTDIFITTPISIRRPSLPRLHLPKLGIGAALAAIGGLLGRAFILAYVEPYTIRRQPPAVLDDTLEGRDPSW